MSPSRFRPKLVVHHTRRVPQPILPVDYSYFLEMNLPLELVGAPLKEQMTLVKELLKTRARYQFEGPFGRVIGFELRSSPNVTVYFNAQGEFAE